MSYSTWGCKTVRPDLAAKQLTNKIVTYLILMSLSQGRNRDADREHGLVDTSRGGEGGTN